MIFLLFRVAPGPFRRYYYMSNDPASFPASLREHLSTLGRAFPEFPGYLGDFSVRPFEARSRSAYFEMLRAYRVPVADSFPFSARVFEIIYDCIFSGCFIGVSPDFKLPPGAFSRADPASPEFASLVYRHWGCSAMCAALNVYCGGSAYWTLGIGSMVVCAVPPDVPNFAEVAAESARLVSAGLASSDLSDCLARVTAAGARGFSFGQRGRFPSVPMVWLERRTVSNGVLSPVPVCLDPWWWSYADLPPAIVRNSDFLVSILAQIPGKVFSCYNNDAFEHASWGPLLSLADPASGADDVLGVVVNRAGAAYLKDYPDCSGKDAP